MDMVIGATNLRSDTTESPDAAPEILMEIVAPSDIDHSPSVLRAEDDVIVE
jgi:hypothetical protein